MSWIKKNKKKIMLVSHTKMQVGHLWSVIFGRLSLVGHLKSTWSAMLNQSYEVASIQLYFCKLCQSIICCKSFFLNICSNLSYVFFMVSSILKIHFDLKLNITLFNLHQWGFIGLNLGFAIQLFFSGFFPLLFIKTIEISS